jgi:hypothetical protein
MHELAYNTNEKGNIGSNNSQINHFFY